MDFYLCADAVDRVVSAKVVEGMPPIRVPFGIGFVGCSAQGEEGVEHGEGMIINVRDAYDDPRFDRSFDLKSGYRTKSILCIPIFVDDKKNQNQNEYPNEIQSDGSSGGNGNGYSSGSGGGRSGGRLIGILQCINKLQGSFDDDDVSLMSEFCSEISTQILLVSSSSTTSIHDIHGTYTKLAEDPQNIAVIIVKVTSVSSFFFYCLLFNHSFQTNPKKSVY